MTTATRQQSTCCPFPVVKRQMPVHLPPPGVFLPTLLTPCTCMSFPGQQMITIWAAKCLKGRQGKDLVHPWVAAGSSLGVGKWLWNRNPVWQQGARWVYAKLQYQGDLCPCFTLCLPITDTLLRFLQTPTVVFRFNKASFLPPPQLVILKIAKLP